MKTYKFKVEVPEVKNGKSSLMDSFINEARDEQRQLDITHKINKKTTEVHRQILIDFITEINEELSSVGFNEFKLHDNFWDGNNHYHKSEAILQAPCRNHPYRLFIEGENDREFKDSKYTTFTGEYKLKFGYPNSLYTTSVKTVDDVLNKLKGDIIEHIKKQ